MPTQTTLLRVESFPFDSRSDGYDADGYPVYDRAVGATMLRETFRKFFSDGVFPSPGTALQISKGPGLTVTIQPGIFIINGAMGGYLTDEHSLTLDTAAPQGNVCYGIMLRYDENEQYRSCYLRVVRGDAASSPQPPAPDQSTLGVMEYRLGYVTVPTGATDLSAAVVTNEKGLDVCPYAAPFEEIDMSGVTADAMASASEALQSLLSYFETYRGAIDAALSDEEATYLQQQITAIQEQLANTDLSGSVDNETIEYATKLPGDATTKLRIKGSGVKSEHIANGSITMDKLSADFRGFFPSGDPDNDNELFVSSGDGGVWKQVRDLLEAPRTSLWSGTWSQGTITLGQNINAFGLVVATMEGSSSGGAVEVLLVRSKFDSLGKSVFSGVGACASTISNEGMAAGVSVVQFYTDSNGLALNPRLYYDSKNKPAIFIGMPGWSTVVAKTDQSIIKLEGLLK